MQVEVINVSVENKGKYRQAQVVYKGPDGKVDSKKYLVSFNNKDVFKTFSEAKQGDIFEVKSEKNEKGHWDWTEATPAGKNTSAAGRFEGTAKAARSTYETPEERAKRQVYIVRQSALERAIELITLNKPKGTVSTADVIAVARDFEAFVFAIEAPTEPQPQPAEVT